MCSQQKIVKEKKEKEERRNWWIICLIYLIDFIYIGKVNSN